MSVFTIGVVITLAISAPLAILFSKLMEPKRSMIDENAGSRPIKRSTGPFGFMNTVYRGGEKYLTRSWIGRLRFHYFHRSDIDDSEDAHDHPWPFWTFPLISYVEEVVTPITFPRNQEDWNKIERGEHMGYNRTLQVVRAFHWHYRPAEHLHRVMGRYAGGVTHEFYGFIPMRASLAERYHSWGPPVYEEKPIMTIVWRGAFCRTWGFLKNRDGKWCWMDFATYHTKHGKNAPCE